MKHIIPRLPVMNRKRHLSFDPEVVQSQDNLAIFSPPQNYRYTRVGKFISERVSYFGKLVEPGDGFQEYIPVAVLTHLMFLSNGGKYRVVEASELVPKSSRGNFDLLRVNKIQYSTGVAEYTQNRPGEGRRIIVPKIKTIISGEGFIERIRFLKALNEARLTERQNRKLTDILIPDDLLDEEDGVIEEDYIDPDIDGLFNEATRIHLEDRRSTMGIRGEHPFAKGHEIQEYIPGSSDFPLN